MSRNLVILKNHIKSLRHFCFSSKLISFEMSPSHRGRMMSVDCTDLVERRNALYSMKNMSYLLKVMTIDKVHLRISLKRKRLRLQRSEMNESGTPNYYILVS